MNRIPHTPHRLHTYTYILYILYYTILYINSLKPVLMLCYHFQDDNVGLREEIEGLHRKYEALKRFAAQKKIRLPAEFEQYQ